MTHDIMLFSTSVNKLGTNTIKYDYTEVEHISIQF